MKRRSDDNPKTLNPIWQFLGALLVALSIGGISGTVSGVILTAKLEERINSVKQHVQSIDERVTYIERKPTK